MPTEAQPPRVAAEARRASTTSGREELGLDPESLAWVVEAQQGDRLAFARLHRRWAPVVHGILIAHVPPRDTADLLQEVFLAVLEQISTLERPDRFAAWLTTIARNRARDLLRRRRPTLDLDQVPEPIDAHSSESEVEAAEESRRILAAIRSLPEAYRETLALRLVEGLSGAVIAERTGMTHASVRVNLCRGMRQLRETLAAGEPGRP